MGKVEGIIKSEIVRLAKREVRKISVPLGRDVRTLKATVSLLRKTVSELGRFAALQQKEMEKGGVPLKATPEEVKVSRFSPRLIRSLRERLGLSQKEMATLAGVTIGAVYQWESGKFDPRDEKKAVIVALRKLGKREARRLLEQRATRTEEKKAPARRAKRARRRPRRK
jgi:DNA-binding transcriptional regulator YiaG